MKEAKRVGAVNVTAIDQGRQLSSAFRAQDELQASRRGAAYVHMTSNNTIEGTQWNALPDVGDAPLVSDTSSDMFSRADRRRRSTG